jgi:hypothetical protein
MTSRRYFRGRARPGEMNKLEAEYAARLKNLAHTGEIAWWAFEPIKLKLARLTTYTPDFLVMRADGLLECHETKGFWQDDARAKIKIAAELFPFRFIAITKKRGEWVFEEF